MILYHVAQRTDLVIKLHSIADTKFLCHGDLHMVDHLTTPQWFKDGVAKSQRQQVLHGFFAKVMVDAEDLVFLKTGADFIVDLARGSVVMPDRLLQHDTHIGRLQVCLNKPASDRTEKGGRRRKIDRTNH